MKSFIAKVATAASFITCALASSSVASAYPLHFERYLVCKSPDERAFVESPEPKAPRDELLALPRKRPPLRLDGEQLINIDVALTRPLPTRRVDVAIAPLAPRVVVVESRNDFRCIGWQRGRAGVSRVIGAGPGTRFRHHQNPESYRRTHIVHAGNFALRETIPALRRILVRPLPPGVEGWEEHEIITVKRDAAVALADMGERAASQEILGFIELLERVENFNDYDMALEAMHRLDAALAEKHALAVLEREAAKPSERLDFFVRALLPFVTTRSPTTLALAQRLEAVSSQTCRLAAFRITQGDAPLLAEVRPHLQTDLRSSLTANCYNELIQVVGSGQDPDEVDMLIHRQRWLAIVQLLGRMKRAEAAGRADPRFSVARAKLKAWLLASTELAHLYDPNHADARLYHYVSEDDALYTVALAHLGDAAAKRSLLQLIGDGKNEGVGPWVAAFYGLELDIAGVSEAISGLLRVGIRRQPVRFSRDTWPNRGHRTITEEGRVIEALHRRGDVRYTLGLLFVQGYVRELTAFKLARSRTPEACRLIGERARDARDDAIEFAFWSLTRLGTRCQKTMRALARDPAQSEDVRGMAIETLAMLRDPLAIELARHNAGKKDMRAALQRAELIANSPE